MRILITGGCGFIGSYLCLRLAKAGHQMTAFDLPGVARFAGDPPAGVKVVEGSVTSIHPDAVAGHHVVIHAGAVLGVERTLEKPRYTLDVNIGGTRQVVDACEEGGVPRLVYLSSSEIYGEADRTPTPEDAPPSPLPGYGVSKLAGEEYVRTFRRSWTILRPFNVYGPGQGGDFVMPRWCRRVAMGLAPEVFGDGRQARCLLYVDDFCDAVALVISRADAAHRRVFNVGNPQDRITMRDLAELICAGLLVKPSVLGEHPDRPAAREVMERQPDISAIREALGWQPRTPLTAGIRMCLAAAEEQAGRSLETL